MAFQEFGDFADNNTDKPFVLHLETMTSETLLNSRYKVIRTLGSGGMGVVYLVEDTRRDSKVVALKVLKAVGDPEALESFKSEFRNIRGVNHSHIPEVYDFGILSGDESPFFTTEFIDGKPLDSLTDKWTTAQLHEMLVLLCRALSFLHSRSLLHRDIKPENVLGKLNSKGEFELLKLVDFGLAGKKGHVPSDASGTVDYMAPELIQGNPASGASDIYALGMLMYRLSTGKLPFTGQDPLSLAKKRCTTEAPPPFRMMADLPVGLSDVISAMIKIRPEDRPKTARHVIALLNEREGTQFSYETEITRTAYLRSAASVTNVSTYKELNLCKSISFNGEDPTSVVITARRGLGRTRLIREFGEELMLSDGQPKFILSESDLETLKTDYYKVLLVPDIAKIPENSLQKITEAVRSKRAWCVMGAVELTEDLKVLLPSVKEIRLNPLPAEEIHNFISATFPENNFPVDFADKVYYHSMGFPSAIQMIFDELQSANLLTIGLNGWELLPGSQSFSVEHHLVSYLKETVATLSESTKRLLFTLVCSSSALPKEILRGVSKLRENMDEAVEPLNRLGWINTQNNCLALKFEPISQYLYEQIDEKSKREIHLGLRGAWQNASKENYSQYDREIIYHDFKSKVFTVKSEHTYSVLKKCADEGEQKWVKVLLEFALKEKMPTTLCEVTLDLLSKIEQNEGNLQIATHYLSELLDKGNAEITRSNLSKFARYASLEEKLGHSEEAKTILEKCCLVLPSGFSTEAATVLGTLAWICFKQGEREKARELAEQGLVRIPPGTTDAAQALLLGTVGTLSFYRGETDAAGLAWQRCLEVFEAISDKRGLANMYNSLGVLAAQSGDSLKARNLWQKSAELAQEIGDIHRLAGLYNNLGIAALESGSLQDAEESYVKALGLFRKLNSPREQTAILSNLGELSYQRADYSRARAYLTEALHLADSIGDQESQIEPLIYLGKLLINLEELEDAKQTLEKARTVAEQTGSAKGEGQAWEGLALLYARLKTHEKSEVALDHAITLLKQDDDPLALLHVYLSECKIAAEFKKSENINKALESARKVGDTKWDPFTSARTLVYGLLFAEEKIDEKERARTLRKLAVYPEFHWKFHWAEARRMTKTGELKKALDEYGRGVTILKAITARLSEESRAKFLTSPEVNQFKAETLSVRNSLQ